MTLGQSTSRNEPFNGTNMRRSSQPMSMGLRNVQGSENTTSSRLEYEHNPASVPSLMGDVATVLHFRTVEFPVRPPSLISTSLASLLVTILFDRPTSTNCQACLFTSLHTRASLRVAVMATTSAPSNRQLCSNCQSTAPLRCSRCLEGLDEEAKPLTTYYCNAECQKANWASHKSVCSARQACKQLFPAGHLTQAAFVEYRRREFDIAIVEVEKRGHDIYLWEREYEEQEILVPFPESLLPDQDDQNAVLVYATCGDALARLHTFIGYCLKGQS